MGRAYVGHRRSGNKPAPVLVNGDLLDRSHMRARRVGLIVISWKSEIMQKVAADLAQLLGLERVLWEQEHLVTYGFDGTATLYGEAGCVYCRKRPRRSPRSSAMRQSTGSPWSLADLALV